MNPNQNPPQWTANSGNPNFPNPHNFPNVQNPQNNSNFPRLNFPNFQQDPNFPNPPQTLNFPNSSPVFNFNFYQHPFPQFPYHNSSPQEQIPPYSQFPNPYFPQFPPYQQTPIPQNPWNFNYPTNNQNTNLNPQNSKTNPQNPNNHNKTPIPNNNQIGQKFPGLNAKNQQQQHKEQLGWSVDEDGLLAKAWVQSMNNSTPLPPGIYGNPEENFWRRIAMNFDKMNKGGTQRSWLQLKERWSVVYGEIRKFELHHDKVREQRKEQQKRKSVPVTVEYGSSSKKKKVFYHDDRGAEDEDDEEDEEEEEEDEEDDD